MPDTFKAQPNPATRISAWLEITRISNAPTLLSNVTAGLCLACATVNVNALWGISLMMLCFYSAGMMLNDLWDLPVDRKERPQRPLPAGLLTSRQVGIAIALLFGLGLAGLATRPPALLAGLVLMALIICYNRWHRHNPLAPLLMGACRGMIYGVAALATCGMSMATLLIGVILMIYIAAVTRVAANEATAAYRLSKFASTVVLWVPLLLLGLAWPNPHAIILGAVFLLWVLAALRPALRHPEAPIGPCIGKLLAGICLFDSVIVARYGQWEWAFLPLCCMVAVIGLHRRIKGS